MSMAISWDDKMDFTLCDIMIGFPISSHIYGLGGRDTHSHTHMHIDFVDKNNFKKPGTLAFGRCKPGLKIIIYNDKKTI